MRDMSVAQPLRQEIFDALPDDLRRLVAQERPDLRAREQDATRQIYDHDCIGRGVQGAAKKFRSDHTWRIR